MERRILVGASAAITAAGFIAACFAVLTWPWITVEPVTTCQPEHGVSSPSVLVIGDSWATHSAIGRGMINAARRNGGDIRVCQIGFSGYSAPRIASALKAEMPSVGQAPDILVVIDGVNDAGGHYGASRYVEANHQITSLFPSSTRSFILAVPRYSDRAIHRSLGSLVIHRVRSCLTDFCRWDSRTLYRSALKRRPGRSSIIPFDGFIPEYEGHEDSYADGIHLTNSEYFALGEYLEHAIADKKDLAQSAANAH